METIQLTDPQILPTNEVIAAALGETFPVFDELIKTISTDPFNLEPNWHYYNDGKAWLCKVGYKKKTIFWLALLVLTTLSLMPTGLLPPQVFSLWDKAQHALGFGWLTLLGLLAYPNLRVRLPLLLLAHGGLIEVAQAATGWRYGEWMDLLADAVGIAVVMGLWWFTATRSTR